MSAEKICAHFFWARLFLFSSLDLKPCELPSEAAPILPADWRRPPPWMARRRGVPQARRWAQAPGPPLEGNAKSSPSCQTGLARTVSRSGPQASESSRPPIVLPASGCARRLRDPAPTPQVRHSHKGAAPGRCAWRGAWRRHGGGPERGSRDRPAAPYVRKAHSRRSAIIAAAMARERRSSPS